MMTALWPQLVFIVLSAMGAVITLQKDKRLFEYIGTFLALCTTHGLLYAGGFYDALVR